MDTLVALIFLGIVAFAAIGLGVSKVIEWRWGELAEDGTRVRLQHRAADYVTQAQSAPPVNNAVSTQQDAVKENPENGKTIHLTPVELDRMLRDAREEATARAVGVLAGKAINPATHRAAALIALGLEGRRYQRWKPIADEAQATAQLDHEPPPPAPPRELTVYQGRPDERRIPLDAPDEAMEPLPR